MLWCSHEFKFKVVLNLPSLNYSIMSGIVSQKSGNAGFCKLSVCLSQNKKQIFSSVGSKISIINLELRSLIQMSKCCSYKKVEFIFLLF